MLDSKYWFLIEESIFSKLLSFQEQKIVFIYLCICIYLYTYI